MSTRGSLRSSSSSSLSSSSTDRAASTTSTTPLLLRAPKTIFSTLLALIRRIIGIFRSSASAYLGPSLVLNEKFAAARLGQRDRFVLVNQAVDFAVFHREGEGLPEGFKVYRVRKGWRAGILGWRGAKYLFGHRKDRLDVTPNVTCRPIVSNGKIAYVSPTHTTTDFTAVPSKSSIRQIRDADLDKLALSEVDASNANTREFNSVTHISVHNPLDHTNDGYYRFVITDADDNVLITTPDYTLRSSFISFGILRGSTLQAMPLQFVGAVLKTAVAGSVSGVMTLFWVTGALPGGFAARLFAWYFRKEISDAKERAWAMAQQRGAVKPADYVARAAGGALPGSAKRFKSYEEEYDGKTGSWVVKGVGRDVFRQV